jgi:diamine N-acetyltransferase
MLLLKSISREDVASIRSWPPYPGQVADLDYALRCEGWLDQFLESPTTRRFAAWDGLELIAFSVLTRIAEGAAEFYIAVHPERIGRGIGRELTNKTVCFGFQELGLDVLYKAGLKNSFSKAPSFLNIARMSVESSFCQTTIGPRS